MGVESDRLRDQGRRNAAIARRRIAAASLIGAILFAQPATVMAQTTNPYADTAIPYGSPLAGSATQTNPYAAYGAATGADTTNGSTSSTTLQPTDVNGANSASGTGTTNGSTTNGSTTNDESGTDQTGTNAQNGRTTNTNATRAAEILLKKPAPPSEFELYVQKTLGEKLPRFGADLLVPSNRDFAAPATTTVPPSYILNPGDTILIGLSGSVDGTVDATIDTDGRIFLPKVGPLRVAGIPYGDLKEAIIQAIGTQYRDFRVSVSVAKLRGVRVYVTGFANNPGAYSVNSLSTMVNAVLASGGPAAGGSFRTIQLFRDGKLVSNFDLYDLIRNGDKSKDAILQNEDVLYIPPVGPQLALTGSVNEAAIYEAKPGESMETLLGYAGGPAVLADKSRVIVYRIADEDHVGREVPREALSTMPGEGGDIVQVLSQGSLIKPLERQSVVVRIEGEVEKPGNYYVAPGTSLDQVMAMAGGTTSRAFVYGTSFQRVSVRQQQRQSFEEAIEQFEVSLAAAPLSANSAVDSGTSAAQVLAARATLDRLRRAQPDGRVVLDLLPTAQALPGTMTVENNDHIYIPPKATTVGVFGAVYRPASFALGDNTPVRVGDYLKMAGGPLRVADKGQIFVVRANGAVISKRNGALNAHVLPGDVIFVPVKTQSTSPWAKVLQISSVLFQLGLATAAFVALAN